MRVSGGDLCTKCRSTDRAGRRDQVLLPLTKLVRGTRVPGFVAERCRRQMQRGEDSVAVKVWRNTAIFWAPQEGLQSNFKSFCPCQKNSHRCGDCFFRYGEFSDPKHFSAKIFSVPHRKLQSWQANLPEPQAIQMQCRNAVQKSMPPITESQG